MQFSKRDGEVIKCDEFIAVRKTRGDTPVNALRTGRENTDNKVLHFFIFE